MPTVTFVNTGKILMPYAPTRLRGGRDASGNIFIEWDRRSRFNNDWITGTPNPLGEEVEQYRLLTYGGSGYAAVAITIISSVQSAQITAAAQVSAFGSLRAAGNCYIGVAQLGRRGFGYEIRGVL